MEHNFVCTINSPICDIFSNKGYDRGAKLHTCNKNVTSNYKISRKWYGEGEFITLSINFMVL